MSLQWAWMNVQLADGDVLSIWSNIDAGSENAWATVMHADGSHSVAFAEPLASGISEYWHSDRSGHRYHTRWSVRIPDLALDLDVHTQQKNAEIYSETPIPGSCYEGPSTVTGTRHGEPIHGICFVEITGAWNEHCERARATSVEA